MPMVGTRSQSKIIADYELLQELREKWRNSKVLAGIEPADARMYEVFNLPNYSSDGIAMFNGHFVALLPSKDTVDPYYFIEMVCVIWKKAIPLFYFQKMITMPPKNVLTSNPKSLN